MQSAERRGSAKPIRQAICWRRTYQADDKQADLASVRGRVGPYQGAHLQHHRKRSHYHYEAAKLRETRAVKTARSDANRRSSAEPIGTSSRTMARWIAAMIGLGTRHQRCRCRGVRLPNRRIAGSAASSGGAARRRPPWLMFLVNTEKSAPLRKHAQTLRNTGKKHHDTATGRTGRHRRKNPRFRTSARNASLSQAVQGPEQHPAIIKR